MRDSPTSTQPFILIELEVVMTGEKGNMGQVCDQDVSSERYFVNII